MSAALALQHRFVEGDPTAPALLLLHGTGGGPDDLFGLAEQLNPKSALLAPAGPVSENGMARWFRRLREGVFDHEDVQIRADQLADFVGAARDEYDLADRRLIAVGFSNGANIAAAVLLQRPEVLTEAVLFSTMNPLPEPPRHDLSAARVLLSNGQRDPMAPEPSAHDLVAALRDRGADVTTHWHPGGHQLTREGLQAAVDWIG